MDEATLKAIQRAKAQLAERQREEMEWRAKNQPLLQYLDRLDVIAFPASLSKGNRK